MLSFEFTTVRVPVITFYEVTSLKQPEITGNTSEERGSQSDDDRRWDELLVNTSPEQWEKLGKMFSEDEQNGMTDLDFTDR